MDPLRFDALTRRLAHGTSRRQVLKGVGVALASALAVGAQPAGASDCKAAGKACSKNGQCCSGLCAPPPGKTSVAHSGSVCCDVGQVLDTSGACCTPDSLSTTCSGLCGTQTNNCGQSVDCGLCPIWSPCTTDAQCASGICNSTYHLCMGCLEREGPCTRQSECCAGSTCEFSGGFPVGVCT